jgi:hypothetical protein
MSDCFRWLDSNFVDIDILANNDVSSEQAAFPIENAFNTNRRSKVWRSNGYYEVTASNNVIIFRETGGGPDLTATLTVGNYLRAALLTEIKAALELTGASTYTVTFNSNFKFVMASNGAGGGGVFQLRGSSGSFTALDLLGLDAVDLTGSLTYTADAARIHTSEWILWDMGIATNPTNFVLIDARNEPLKFSPTATVKLEGNHTNNFSSPVFSTTLTYDDRLLHHFNDTGIAATALRYWRVQFIDKANPNGFVQVGAFYLGNFYSPTRGRVQFPIKITEIDRTNTIYSEGGQTFSELRPKTNRLDIDYFGLTKQEKEELERIFETFGKGLPFFISADTDAVYGSSRQYHIRYVKFSSETSYELIRPNIFRMSISLEEQL